MNKGKVLIIDDEEIVRISCRRILVPEGYDVETVKSAVEGFALLAGGRFDVVLTDLKMPDIDGIEVLRRVKKEWPEVEVIVITGYQTINTAVQAIKLGAFDYLEKPFTPDGIVSAIERAMEQRGTGEQASA
ncbi:MAG: response regulator [Alphaproteobacteria bacterium]|uniref:Response regulator n=1 Tax=Candidatus Nitrobium versatile TaxID=2884831 RepID=A0A953JGD3_9BACT|nr:response regulator [Candidatus Nitrobium versatile]